ncbi:thioester reductase family protein [Aspergillus aculeatinus CBS 121060]|uniref:Thioester reductase family protein n=1 Tax=Aspergillus aculeatinus CBS 121060 TaxID=1448322 RepID=A0ACD1H4S8_9EURO|nr:thioester reductase family protein [Aspergillus aculeatinus CBS 121060]RAH68388.1 thioester reductase family protein [Aspergillus aculeatinus CBS 121060]
MPEQSVDILTTHKVHFVVGDVTKPNLALRAAELDTLRAEVTVVIHCAANISLQQELRASVTQHCVSQLQLLDLLSDFVRLQTLLYLSTTYVNSFLPGGRVGEKIHELSSDPDQPVLDATKEVQSILEAGESTYASQFMVPYAYAKYLTERLTLDRKPRYTVLIVRPSHFGPAIAEPFPYYGFNMAIPMHSYLRFLLGSDEHGLEQIIEQTRDVQFTWDEIPVDQASNTCLLHLALGTQGIVHAAAALYVTYSMADIVHMFSAHVPPAAHAAVCNYASEQAPSHAEFFFQLITTFPRDWIYDCSRSEGLQHFQGPLSLGLGEHDPERFMQVRVQRVTRQFLETLKTAQGSRKT